ncbi:hypothetical protein TrRE_jg12912 [Triparma retinervis]|uniref:Uncharacterized protein n=1 Tax=Triparma retinervis TaxID=2557542 RepID=A0A9W7DLR8_9STRA|nr:hypothetical protein TrRE_jg12912 [Triparma retinervis]
MGTDNKPEVQTSSGLPKIDKAANYKQPVIISLVGQAICLGIGAGIYFVGNRDKSDALMSSIIANDQHYMYLAGALIGTTVRFVNMFPMIHKARIMTGKGSESIGKNLRSNPYIYQMVDAPGAPGSKNSIVFQNDGAAGEYNRSNRSLHHMVENMGAMLLGVPLAGYVFPFPTFVSSLVWAVGRVWHQVGYASGYGSHGGGFMFATLATNAVEGMLLVVALRGFGFFN